MFQRRPARLAVIIMVAIAAIAGTSMAVRPNPLDAQTIPQPAHTRSNGGVTASGVLQPVRLVSVGTQRSGTVVEVIADFNDPVEKGQPIAQLAPDAFEAAVREAEAALTVAAATVQMRAAAIERAKSAQAAARAERARAEAQHLGAGAELARTTRDLERKRSLAKRGNLPVRELDDARTAEAVAAAALQEAEAERRASEAAVRAAAADIDMAEADHAVARAVAAQRQAALDRARIDLAQTTIRAPVDGVVLSRSVEVGQTVAASLNAPTLFTVAGDLREMEVHASVDESDIGRIRVGQAATFTVNAYPDRSFRGTVRQIQRAPQVIQNVVTYRIVIATTNADASLLPGMTALVDIKSGRVPEPAAASTN